MTNEQWIKSLDTDRFADYFSVFQRCEFCINCKKDNGMRAVNFEDCKNMTCKAGILAWLKQERDNEVQGHYNTILKLDDEIKTLQEKHKILTDAAKNVHQSWNEFDVVNEDFIEKLKKQKEDYKQCLEQIKNYAQNTLKMPLERKVIINKINEVLDADI